MTENNKNNIAYHILPTSSTLLGLCFVVVSSIQAMQLRDKTLIDDLATVAMLLFLLASIFSYTSIRIKKRADFYEKVADIIFMSGLGFISLVSLIFTFEIIH